MTTAQSELIAGLLARSHFPPAGEHLDCAVSGGADSLALMVLGVASGCVVSAYHVDHGLRAGSAREAGIVERAAARHGAAFFSLVVSCAPGPNLEARARAARFAVLPPGVATGHTADDQAETIVLNLLRGAGSDGLRGMDTGARHPILALRRSETRELVASLGLEVVEDPSNDDPVHRRNRVRHELLPLADDIARRDLVPVLARQAALIADEVRLLDSLASEIDPTDVVALRSCHVALARRALRSWLRTLAEPPYAPDAAAIDRVLAVVRGEMRACEVAGGRRIRRSRGRLLVDPALGVPCSGPDRSEVAG